MNHLLDRLAANHLWRKLRDDDWRGPTSQRKLGDWRGGHDLRAIAGGSIPRAEALNPWIRQTNRRALSTVIHPDQRNALPARVFIVLWRRSYARAWTTACQSAREDIELAVLEQCGDPYRWHQNGRGGPGHGWNLERVYDPFITGHVYRFLDELVSRALLWHEGSDPTPELIEDDETGVSSDTRNRDLDEIFMEPGGYRGGW